ncbi:SsrA-binding protein SmpB [Candidatus Neomarinimicrobiota bacterium]
MEKKTVATNRKARHLYHILETYESGISLLGTEVKAIREGKVSLLEGYARFMDGDLYLMGVHIGDYSHAGHAGHVNVRDRKLLLNKRELGHLKKSFDVKGQTLIPLSIYFKRGWAKVDLAVCRGKQQHDKRRAIAERDVKRELTRTTRQMMKDR